MGPARGMRSALLLVAMLATACAGPVPATPDPEVAFALPTAPPETDPPAPPPGTIPPGFVFPVPGPLNDGNADIYAQRALFHRTGSLCFTHQEERGGVAHIEGLAATMKEREGLLEDGRSYIGPLADALAVLDLEPTGIETANVAYGIGPVPANSTLVHIPAGSIWAPRLDRFDLSDGRTGWSLTGSWVAVVDGPCSVLPTTSG